MQATAQLALHLVDVEKYLSDWQNKSERTEMQASFVRLKQAKLPATHVKQHSTPSSKRSVVSRSTPRQKTHMAPAH